MTKVFNTPAQFIEWRKSLHGSIGFVPTMGALHEGHESLLVKARSENDVVVLSVFVNPTQFNNPDDLSCYPKTWEADLALAQKLGVDAIFFPQYGDMYPDAYTYKVTENNFSKELDGAHRPGHFDGVLTIVNKLFNIILPTRAYFGEKDFQQLSLIQGMVQALFMSVEIVPVPTVREESGLALSSRNRLLAENFKKISPQIFKIISNAPSAQAATEELNRVGFEVEYVTDRNGRRYVAVKAGNVRLIDNVEI